MHALWLRASMRITRNDCQGLAADLEQILEIQPNNGKPLDDLAWLLATCPEETARDGRRAVELARRAIEVSKDHIAFRLDTLAAAYAEMGDLFKAVELQRKAVEVGENDDDFLRKDYRSHLQTYRKRQTVENVHPYLYSSAGMTGAATPRTVLGFLLKLRSHDTFSRRPGCQTVPCCLGKLIKDACRPEFLSAGRRLSH